MMQAAPIRYESIVLRGGLDQITPTLALKPGVCKEMSNFECSLTGGYARIKGYERFDGRSAPSDATYGLLYLASFTNTPAVGATVTGTPSTATGVVSVVGSDHIAVTKRTGTFAVSDALTVGATPIGTVTAIGGTLTTEQSAQYLNAAADIYRADITTITGSGVVRGVVLFNDVVYAWRNNAGGTAVDMWKSTTSGWAAVTLYNEVSFTAGSGSVDDGDTLTQGANTATVKRVVIESGTLAAGTAAGRLIVTTPAPGNFAAGAATTTGGGALTLSGAQTAITFPAGGRYEFDTSNFAGSAQSIRLYGANGVGRAFEFDGTTVVPIYSGTPTHVAAFKNHLCLGTGSSILHSAPGLPYNFQVVDGAGEIAVGDTITGLIVQSGSQSGGALVVYTRNNTSVLYGTSAADWNLVSMGTGVGARRYSAVNMVQTIALDDRGVMSLAASQNYGNFDAAALTAQIQTFINEKRNLVTAATVSRERSQYRAFFSDKAGLYLTVLNGQLVGAAPVVFGHAVNCAYNGEYSTGAEAIFVGTDDGYVMQLDKGTSFDGGAINASLTLGYNSLRSPRTRKRFRRAAIEVSGNTYAAFDFGYSLGYGMTSIAQPAIESYEAGLSGTRWDNFVWDNFVWDGISLAPYELEVSGTAENIAMSVSSSTDYIDQFYVNSIIVHYSPRRGLR